METNPVKIRTSISDAQHVRTAWQFERRRLRRLVNDRMRRHLKKQGWPTDSQAKKVDVPPAELRRRRKVRREFVAAVTAGGVRPTAEAVVGAALEAELDARGWLAGPVPQVDREMVPVARWPGTGSGQVGQPWRGVVNARVRADLPQRTVARCWEHSAEAVTALIAWRDAHPKLVHRSDDPDAWAEYDRLATGVLTPGDVYRAAKRRERTDYGPGQAAARVGLSLGEWRRAVRAGMVRRPDVDGARWSAALVERARGQRARLRTEIQVLAAPEYRWGQAPAHLLTRAQLAEPTEDQPEPLRPGGPIRGVIHYRRGRERMFLYDLHEALPKREPTPAQTAAVQRRKVAMRTCVECAKVVAHPSDLTRVKRRCPACVTASWTRKLAADRRDAAVWAREVLDDPATVFLDTETTGLFGFLVEIAITDGQGQVLLDTLVDPRCEIEDGAAAVHGIGAADLVGAPTYAELAEQLWQVLRGRRVVIYNLVFDRDRILINEVLRAAAALGPEPLNLEERYWEPLERASRWECAMQAYAAWWGDWDDYHGSYTWQRLGGGHRALGDCHATRERLVTMAPAWRIPSRWLRASRYSARWRTDQREPESPRRVRLALFSALPHSPVRVPSQHLGQDAGGLDHSFLDLVGVLVQGLLDCGHQGGILSLRGGVAALAQQIAGVVLAAGPGLEGVQVVLGEGEEVLVFVPHLLGLGSACPLRERAALDTQHDHAGVVLHRCFPCGGIGGAGSGDQGGRALLRVGVLGHQAVHALVVQGVVDSVSGQHHGREQWALGSRAQIVGERAQASQGGEYLVVVLGRIPVDGLANGTGLAHALTLGGIDGDLLERAQSVGWPPTQHVQAHVPGPGHIQVAIGAGHQRRADAVGFGPPGRVGGGELVPSGAQALRGRSGAGSEAGRSARGAAGSCGDVGVGAVAVDEGGRPRAVRGVFDGGGVGLVRARSLVAGDPDPDRIGAHAGRRGWEWVFGVDLAGRHGERHTLAVHAGADGASSGAIVAGHRDPRWPLRSHAPGGTVSTDAGQGPARALSQ